jgi:hypothetical protein
VLTGERLLDPGGGRAHVRERELALPLVEA